MIRRPPRSTRTDTLFPYTTLFRSLFSDIVLPTATWYEKNDLNTTDMHPFIHPLTAAIDPVWGARSDWDIFRGIAESFSRQAVGTLGTEKDLVRSEEHTSELQSLMRNSYAVLCLKKKKQK